MPTEHQRIGPYEILDELGRGAMGVVYRARHVELGAEVALKVIRGAGADDPKRLARFLREARAAAALAGTSGIVTVHDVGEAGGVVWFAMELVRGRSLEAVLEAGPVAPAQAAAWVAAAARAVGRAHARGILHRDLKPANILVDEAGIPRITDFGLARVATADASITRLTRSDEVVGTPTYMAPEQARAAPLQPTADVYALGATLYELLAGRPAFEADSVLATLVAVLHVEPDPAPLRRAGVPRDLVTVAMRCLEKDPSLRYPTADALADDCDRFARGEPVLARPVSRTTRAWRRLAREPRRAAALGLCAAAAMALLAWGLLAALAGTSGARQLADTRTGTSRADRAAALADCWYVLWRDCGADLALCEDAAFGVPVDGARLRAALERQYARADALAGPELQLPRAWAGLAAVLAGDAAAGQPLVDAAAAADPDDPLSQVLAARAHLARWLGGIRPPEPVVRPTGVEVRPWQEPPGLRPARQAAEAALARAASSPLWDTLRQGAEWRAFAAGAAHFAAGRLAEAAAALAPLADAPPLGDQAGYLCGMAHLLAGAFEPAALALERTSRRGWPRALALAARARWGVAAQAWAAPATAADQLARALDLAETAQRARPTEPGLVELRALLHRQRGELLDATGRDPVAEYRAALALCDQVAEPATVARQRATVGVALCRALGARGPVPAALLARTVADATAAAAGAPEEADPWITLGLAHLERAAADLPAGADPRPALAQAIDALSQALARAPADAEALMQRGLARRLVAEAATARGEAADAALASALADCDAAVAAAPHYAEALGNRAITRWQLADLPGRDADALLARAEADATAALAGRPLDSVLRQARAGIRLRRGERAAARGEPAEPAYATALEDLDAAIAGNRANVGAFTTRANVHWALGDLDAARGADPRPRFDGALADYGAALARNPSDPDARYNRAALLMAYADADERLGSPPERRYRSALADFEQVCAQAPGHWAAEAGRGSALAALGRVDDALAAFQAALAANPEASAVAAEIERLQRLRTAR